MTYTIKARIKVEGWIVAYLRVDEDGNIDQLLDVLDHDYTEMIIEERL